jgi:hypothetical protein
MNHTLRAVLARFDGDYKEAINYCERVSRTTTNHNVSDEYYFIATELEREQYGEAS